MAIIDSEAGLVNYINSLQKDELSSKEIKARFDLFLEFKAREKAIPVHGLFELTPFCNLNCKMCYVHLNHEQYEPERLLSVDTWKHIIEQAYSEGMRDATLTGGECLTYNGFDEIYKLLQQRCLRTSVFTNGVLINDEIIRLFKSYPPTHIQISLYGSSNDAYEHVTGFRVFDTVITNIEALKSAGLPVRIAITPSVFMKDDFEDLILLLKKLAIPYRINSSLITPRSNTNRLNYDITTEDYIYLYNLTKTIYGESIPPADFSELPEPSKGTSNTKGLRCGGGRSSFVIKHDGFLCPCLPFYDIDEDTLEHGFKTAWKRINDFANNYPIPQECETCFYKESCSKCAASHRNALVGHCDRAECQKTKQFILSGLIHLS